MSGAKNILLVGVGGQGTILASKLLSGGLLEAGYDVKMSEIHGMSQRGGSVSSQVRYGDRVYAPVIEKGGADLLVAFEKMEALRWLEYLRAGGEAIVNDFEIPSMPMITGNIPYPPGIVEELRRHAPVTLLDAEKKAEELGNEKVMNVILLGAAIQRMGLDDIDWEAQIEKTVKPQFIELNCRALQAGRALA